MVHVGKVVMHADHKLILLLTLSVYINILPREIHVELSIAFLKNFLKFF